MLDTVFLDNARRLIAARSVSEHGNLAALDVLEPLCREAGLETRRLPAPDTPDRDANLLAGPGGGQGASGDPLLLVTHTDTVSPGPLGAWRTDPFTLTIDGNRAYGLGTADVKLDALCKLEAMKRLRGVRLGPPFWFLGTYGEEVGLRGAKTFAANAPFRPAHVLCGEPSELQLFVAHKGYCLLRVLLEPSSPVGVDGALATTREWEGRAVHSSTPHLGVNAADAALGELAVAGAPAVIALQAGGSTNTIPGHCEAQVTEPVPGDAVDLSPCVFAAGRLVSEWRERVTSLEPSNDERFDPSVAVANLTRMRGSDGLLEIALDARLLPDHDAERLLETFCAQLDRLVGDDVKASVVMARGANGMNLASDARLAQVASRVLGELGLDASFHAKPTSTEAGVFAHLGIEAAVFGPSISIGNAHTANEYALLDQVERAIDAYEALIRALCA